MRRIDPKGIKEYLKRWFARARSDPRRADLSLYAANGSYFFFLSLGPLLALLLSILPYTPLTEQRVMEVLLAYAPEPLARLIDAVVRDIYAGSKATLGLSAALELWSGARFLAGVVRGVGAIGGVKPRGYLRRRVMGALYTAALVLFLVANLTLLLFGERMLSAVLVNYPDGAVLWKLLLRLRVVILMAGLTAGNTLLFCRASGHGRLRTELPGAIVAAVGWLVYTRAFSWALERFGLFGVYGSIAAVSASIVWMYGSLYVLFLGAWLNRSLEENRV
ncbi:MAG: YihY/virulence factor BrkB family protein [Oscillospiraceae bacterium]